MSTERKKQIASVGTIKIESSNGEVIELGFDMPKEVAERIVMAIITWEEDWYANTKTHLEYQQVAAEFAKQRQGNPIL